MNWVDSRGRRRSKNQGWREDRLLEEMSKVFGVHERLVFCRPVCCGVSTQLHSGTDS